MIARVGVRTACLARIALRQTRITPVLQRRTFSKKKKKAKSNQATSSRIPIDPDELDEENDNFDLSDLQKQQEEEEKMELEEDVLIDMDDDLKKFDRYMGTVVERLNRRLTTIRLGVASPDLFDGLRINAYDDFLPFPAVAKTIVKSPILVHVAVHDPGVLPNVEDAIRKSVLQLDGDRIDSSTLMYELRRPSLEARKALIKTLGRVAEKSKQQIRHFYNSSNTRIKKWVEDENRRYILQDRLKKINDKHNKAIKQLQKSKEEEILPKGYSDQDD